MTYSPESVREWFRQTLGISSQPGRGEIQTYCPECGGDVFYFNVYKQVGICHKARCDFRPTLSKLIELVGFAPDQAGVWSKPELPGREDPVVTMPGWPLLKMMVGKLMTSNEKALEYIRSRGIPDEIILNWGLTCDGERVYVPIVSNGIIRNYNSRVLPGVDGMKYMYYPGAKTSSYILGWEESRLWDRISLIENTFVSLALRAKINATTVFGSNLSDTQADLIARSNVKSVAILWDEGAEKKAEKAIKKLHSRGVNAAYWMIKGQPDDHPVDWVAYAADMVYDAARNGIPYVDLRGER